MKKKVKETINIVKNCAKEVYEELGQGWPECVYQEAMEVALREKGIIYESQRVLPISFKGYIVGKSYPDLIIWTKKSKNKWLAIIIDLKWEPGVKEDHRAQVYKYIKELKKHVKENQEVSETGFVINFVKGRGGRVDEGEIEEEGGVQVLNVKV